MQRIIKDLKEEKSILILDSEREKAEKQREID